MNNAKEASLIMKGHWEQEEASANAKKESMLSAHAIAEQEREEMLIQAQQESNAETKATMEAAAEAQSIKIADLNGQINESETQLGTAQANLQAAIDARDAAE